MTTVKTFAALLVLLITNGFVFGGIAWNRSGEATGELSFNQCEFHAFTGRYTETDPVRYLRLYAVPLEIEKNTSNGAQGADADAGAARNEQDRRGYVVVQKGGPEWQDYVRRQTAKKRFYNPPVSNLMIVDGEEELEILLSKHPSVGGRVVVAGYSSGKHDRYWKGAINTIAVESRYRAMAREIRQARNLEVEEAEKAEKEAGGTRKPLPCTPTHRITIKWGQRYQPWISSIEAM